MRPQLALPLALVCAVFAVLFSRIPVAGAAPSKNAEACGQIVVVAYAGAQGATVTRTKAQAEARAKELLAKAQQGDFAALAKANSDAPSSGPRGGVMGTFAKDEWPEVHAAIKETVFALKDDQVSPKLVDAPYGYVIARRCKVEKAHSRHILIRYAGAKNAKSDVTRTKEEARKLADTVRSGIKNDKTFLAAVAKHSEDGSRERGGDVGSPGKGRLALPYEEALFAMKVGDISAVVESDFGFHIIQRLPD